MAALRQGCNRQNVIAKLQRLHCLTVTRTCAQHKVIESNNEQSLTVDDDDSHYPPVKPKLPPGSWGRMDRYHAWRWDSERQEISQMKTVEKKLEYLTKKKFRTWKFFPVARVPGLFSYQCDKTKTHTIVESHQAVDKHSKLPELYKDIKLDQDVVSKCKHLVNNNIKTFDYINRTKTKRNVNRLKICQTKKHVQQVDNALSHLQSKELLMSLISYLSGHYGDVRKCTVDEHVRIAATWNRHGVKRMMNPFFGADFDHKVKYPDKFEENAGFFGEHVINFQIRKALPLQKFVELTDPLVDSVTYPSFSYKPTVLGQFHEIFQRGFEPGFNVGDPNEFIHLNVVMLNESHLRSMFEECGKASYEEALQGYALSTGFLSTVAQAHFQGFNMYEDLTYPITTQTILTDGQQFMFSTYQLNTLQLWKDDLALPLHNLCWISRPQDLWKIQEISMEGRTAEEGDETSETIIDKKTLETLLKFLVIPPAKIAGKRRPYLDRNTKPKFGDVTIPIRGKEQRAFHKKYQSILDIENGFKIKDDYSKK